MIDISFLADFPGASWLLVGPPEPSWWRLAHRNELDAISILEDSALEAAMPSWETINLSWSDLAVLPSCWKAALSQWRGVNLIFDTSNGKSYVGSAYGADNLLGRWTDYSNSGRGGNRLLKERDPRNFRFMTSRVAVSSTGCWPARCRLAVQCETLGDGGIPGTSYETLGTTVSIER